MYSCSPSNMQQNSKTYIFGPNLYNNKYLLTPIKKLIDLYNSQHQFLLRLDPTFPIFDSELERDIANSIIVILFHGRTRKTFVRCNKEVSKQKLREIIEQCYLGTAI